MNGKEAKPEYVLNYPVTFVLFGATGDLAEKKLFPALFGLFLKKLLPRHFKIVAFARRPFSDESFRALILPGLLSVHKIAESDTERMALVDSFLKKIFYHQGLLDEPKPYIALINRLGDLDKELGACSHKIFHLAVSPFFYETVLDHLERSALNLSCTDGTGQTRLLIEKPIGTDLASARTINGLLGKVFHEDQIYRVDHYLAKNALLRLLSLRFEGAGASAAHDASLISVWNGRYIESMKFSIYEKVTAEGRGAFYDRVGALRDVGQNHLLEMFALATADSEAHARTRVAALRSAHAPEVHASAASAGTLIKRGQYEGYAAEEGVAKESDTETYFKVPLVAENAAWKGVMFELEGGKALCKSEVALTVTFRKPNISLAGKDLQGVQKMTFYIQPEPRVEIIHSSGTDTILVNALGGSARSAIRSAKGPDLKNAPDNYEKIYFDALQGDRSHFVSKEEVEASWAYTDAVRKELLKVPLLRYKQGTCAEDIS